MKKPIAISLSPNTDKTDVALAWKLLFSRSMREDAQVLSKVAHAISRRFENRFVVLNSSGRQALYDLLRVMNIGLGDEVIIQAFTCIAVPEPILWVGAKPIYADTIKDGYTVDVEDIRKKITAKTKAIIIQHTFGIPGPINEVMQIAKEKNILVIEDCAHAFGSKIGEKPVGTFADASFMSFGRDKSLSSVYGGACVVKSRTHMEALHALANKRSYAPSAWVLQQLLHPIIFSIAVPLYYVFNIGKIIIIAGQKLGLLSKAVEAIEKQGRKPMFIEYKYSPALAHLLLHQLSKVDAMNDRRRKIAERYMHELSKTSGILPVTSQDSNPSWLRFPMLITNRTQVLFHARQQHMFLGDWYDAVLVPKIRNMDVFRYVNDSCPNAEDVASKVINLPTYPTLTDTQVGQVIALIKQYAS
ncbi:MAG: DegT/DnrJ/EryC1/StrS family aminotransferase [Candidatus Andersenbacteria bacterium]